MAIVDDLLANGWKALTGLSPEELAALVFVVSLALLVPKDNVWGLPFFFIVVGAVALIFFR